MGNKSKEEILKDTAEDLLLTCQTINDYLVVATAEEIRTGGSRKIRNLLEAVINKARGRKGVDGRLPTFEEALRKFRP